MTPDPPPARGGDAIPTEHDPLRWFAEHFDGAAQQVIDFLAGDGVELAGKTVADIGSGDGIIDYGVFTKGRPAKLVGYDVRPTDVDALRRTLVANGLDGELPSVDVFSFAQSGVDHVPAPDDFFDVAFSWSVFEHVDQPIRMLREVRRILKPDGWFFLQLWPFFGSQHGGHLWQNVEQPYAHLTRSPFELNDFLRGKGATDPSRPADDEFRSLNRITVDGLQRAMLAAGLRISKVELVSETMHIPPELSHLPLTDLAISGIKLLAVPA
jgi:SAM-dependent methyltransferase